MTREQTKERFTAWLARWLERFDRPAWLLTDSGKHYDAVDMLAAYQSGYIQATSDATKTLIESRPQAVAR